MEPKFILRAISDNPLLFDALKQFLNDHFDNDDAREDNISNERLGEIYRARLVAKRRLADAFREMAAFKTPNTDGSKRVNRGR